MASPRIRLRKLSEPTISRLPVYQRIVESYLRRDIERIESSQIAELTGVTATTVRRDLAGLGQLGTRGSGYDVKVLNEKIGEALGHDRSYSVVVVGMGNLGHALVNSSNFLIRGATLAALYDADPAVIGTEVAGHEHAHDEAQPKPERAIRRQPEGAAGDCLDGCAGRRHDPAKFE